MRVIETAVYQYDELSDKAKARTFADWIYRQLESEYEHVNSDESVAETIRANEYEFTADGKREG